MVLHAAQLNLMGQLGLVEEPALITLHIAPRQRCGHRLLIDRTDEGVVSVQRIVVVTEGVAQRQAVVEAVVQRCANRLHFRAAHVHVSCIGSAVIGAWRHIDGLALECWDAKVGQALVLQIVSLQQHAGAGAGLDQHRGGQGLAIEKLLVAIAVGALDGTRQAVGHNAVFRCACQVKFTAALVPASQSKAYFAEVGARFFGNPVDQATRGAASIQHRSGAFEHFNLLDIGEIAEVQRVIAQAIDKLIRNGREAANRDLIALAIAVRHTDAWHSLESILNGLRSLIAQQALRHHIDGLRNIPQRGLDFGGAGGRRRVVAGLDLAITANLDFFQNHFGCLLCHRRTGKRQPQRRSQRRIPQTHEYLVVCIFDEAWRVSTAACATESIGYNLCAMQKAGGLY